MGAFGLLKKMMGFELNNEWQPPSDRPLFFLSAQSMVWRCTKKKKGGKKGKIKSPIICFPIVRM